MTREEAKTQLIALKAKFEVLLSMQGLEVSEVFDLAIKALEQTDALDRVRAEIIEMRSKQNCSCSDCILVCNKCLSRAPYDCRVNYCPICGARMEESEGQE